METVLVQINNDKAYRLLEDLEDLNIIKVLEKRTEPQQGEHTAAGAKVKLSEKYAGQLPAVVADELQLYVSQSRN